MNHWILGVYKHCKDQAQGLKEEIEELECEFDKDRDKYFKSQKLIERMKGQIDAYETVINVMPRWATKMMDNEITRLKSQEETPDKLYKIFTDMIQEHSERGRK